MTIRRSNIKKEEVQMIYTFMMVSVWAGLLFQTNVSGFDSMESCQHYATLATDMAVMLDHAVIEADCITEGTS